MKKTYYIMFHIKVKGELQTFGKFYIGQHRALAHGLFKKMRGKADTDGSEVLFVELMETHEKLPLNIQMLACTLDELAENCRVIAKETFKWNNIDPGN
ncbi:MAG: hypothetical protein ACTHMC_23095 [Pseudobacter sp.]|uniref:hypothetical protein n=1 Tax=Pseudobacter sp. TaxID=2045420 RepID=UPI003F802699